MKITVLIENQPSGNLCAEHGLSLAIEYRKKHYLLDTGASDGFIKNAKKLGISLSEIDSAFLSHGHYDHSGGYEAFFAQNQKAKVYAKEEIQEACYSGSDSSRNYIGIPEELLEHYRDRFILIKEDCEIEPGIWLISHMGPSLLSMGVEEIYTGHCTGFAAYEILKTSCGSHLHDLKTGTVITFAEKG